MHLARDPFDLLARFAGAVDDLGNVRARLAAEIDADVGTTVDHWKVIATERVSLAPPDARAVTFMA
jgi:hypothetical protein